MPRIVPYYCLFPQNGKWQILQCLIWAIYDIQTSYGCLKVSEFYQESDSEDSGEEQWVNFFNAYLPFQPSIPTAAISLIPCQTFEDFCLPFKWAAHMAAVTPSPTKCQLQLWILFNIKLKVHVNLSFLDISNAMDQLQCIFAISAFNPCRCNFLAPTGAQGVKMSVCPSVRPL